MKRRFSVGLTTELLIAAVLLLFILAWFFDVLPDFPGSLTGARISDWVDAADMWGSLVIMAPMATAIVATPIPSAPIALAAGAAHGHKLRTVYIIMGAESLGPPAEAGFDGYFCMQISERNRTYTGFTEGPLFPDQTSRPDLDQITSRHDDIESQCEPSEKRY